ncbi:cupin domain-containing protein [Devosia sp.]|uniref:cupin domain-containing protein n=1 Tax=Devosia sp. TaxID=1871048 RepID=UPI003264FBE6
MDAKNSFFAIGLCFAMLQGSGALAADTLTSTPADKVQWADTPFGVQASPVHGDFLTGAHVTFIKFAAGMQTPPHVHSHDYVGIVVKGQGVHYIPGETPTPLPPGSTWSVPANLVHISGCLAGEDCIFALYQADAFDFIPQE